MLSELSDQLVILVSGHISPTSLIFILRSVCFWDIVVIIRDIGVWVLQAEFTLPDMFALMNKTSLSQPIFSTTHLLQIKNLFPSCNGYQFLNFYLIPPTPIQPPPPLHILTLPALHLTSFMLSLTPSIPCLITLHLPHRQPLLTLHLLPLIHPNLTPTLWSPKGKSVSLNQNVSFDAFLTLLPKLTGLKLSPNV